MHTSCLQLWDFSIGEVNGLYTDRVNLAFSDLHHATWTLLAVFKARLRSCFLASWIIINSNLITSKTLQWREHQRGQMLVLIYTSSSHRSSIADLSDRAVGLIGKKENEKKRFPEATPATALRMTVKTRLVTAMTIGRSGLEESARSILSHVGSANWIRHWARNQGLC